MFLLFLAWPFIEIYLFIKVVEIWGFFNAVMATLTSFLLGLLIVKAQGRTFFLKVQTELSQGKVPTRSLINSALLFIGGFLILVPGFFSDIVGVLLVLPGSRHLIALYVRVYLSRKLAAGTFKVFGAGTGFGAAFGGGFNKTRGSSPEIQNERDVSPQVIDVKPISSSEERE